MAELDRLTGLYGAVYIDLYGSTEQDSERIKIADTQQWSLSQEVRTEDATIKGEVSRRHKVIGATSRIRIERWVQGPAVFSREVRAYLLDDSGRIGATNAAATTGGTVTTAQLADMGTTAGVDGGAMGTSGTFFGGATVATAFGTGTASNDRCPVSFALLAVNSTAAGSFIAAGTAGTQTGSVIVTGQGYLVRGDFSVPRDGLQTDALEILVDGALGYAEFA